MSSLTTEYVDETRTLLGSAGYSALSDGHLCFPFSKSGSGARRARERVVALLDRELPDAWRDVLR
ncbi:MAG TPA: hypothetical protein VNW92_17450 [Polyangiaceae bacterium]|jgi:hypothetical protein|nr:hypothetical protein [Polyangiaceae bacterium]